MSENASDSLPERPEDFFAALGLDAPELPADTSGLDEMRAKLKADLDKTQGPHRSRSPLARYWPFGLAAVAGAVFAVIFPPMEGATAAVIAAEVIAGLAGLVCLAAAAIAPQKPGASENVARIGLALAVLALGAQAYMAKDWSREMIDAGLKCGVAVTLTGSLPLLLGFWGLKRSGLPVRSIHAAALTVAALAMTGASVLSHCPLANFWHVLSGHIALPATVAAVLSFVLYQVFVRLRPPPVV